MNQALQLLRQAVPATQAARRLARAHGLSQRQAHRYVRLAQNNVAPVAVPEPAEVFTVKLPRSLIRRVRREARRGGGGIGEWVAAALRRSLPAESSHG